MQCPLPHYSMCHALVALCIAVVVSPLISVPAGLAAGAAFYVGREYTQWESGLKFDWPGLLAPVLLCLTLLVSYWVAT